MSHRAALAIAALVAFSTAASAEETARSGLDLESVQATLAVQALDGWLLTGERGQNPVAMEMAAPAGEPTRQWFYLIPKSGAPVAIVHKSDISRFRGTPGTTLEYQSARDLDNALRMALAARRRVAMEYAPKSGIPSLTRVDPKTVARVERAGAEVVSSANLIQFTKSLWGPEGRVAHHVAAHHLTKLREEALAFVAAELGRQRDVSVADLRRVIAEGMRVRGLVGPPAIVAAGADTATPPGKTAARKTRSIRHGDLLILQLAGALADAERPIFAEESWVAFAGAEVPTRFAEAFAAVALARDRALSLIRERVTRRRAITGAEVDRAVRSALESAGYGERLTHPTGHSLDTKLEGDGANLDDHRTRDTRHLVVGSGFTVGPGLYVPGDFGVRTVVGVHILPAAIEVTSPLQREITPLLPR